MTTIENRKSFSAPVHILAACCTATLVLASSLLAQNSAQPIGVVSKVILDVSRKSSTADWAKASKGDMVATGDRVRTGEQSFAILKFNDNTMVRVRERSELAVTGSIQDKKFSKSVNLDNGAVGFKVAKQHVGEEFRFTSPTSVASVRGTDGYFAMAPGGDTLTIITGNVNLLNRFSSRAVDVGEGFTGISNPDGSVVTRASTREERRAAAEALRTGDQPRKLRLQLRSRDGEKKDLIIDYKE
jgi:hypothetical protein